MITLNQSEDVGDVTVSADAGEGLLIVRQAGDEIYITTATVAGFIAALREAAGEPDA